MEALRFWDPDEWVLRICESSCSRIKVFRSSYNNILCVYTDSQIVLIKPDNCLLCAFGDAQLNHNAIAIQSFPEGCMDEIELINFRFRP